MQARSKERAERILDAAAHVFAEAGFDAATTEAIAERAETSIGSVYQFFPNKDALFDAIASRYFERSRALFERLMAEASATSWRRPRWAIGPGQTKSALASPSIAGARQREPAQPGAGIRPAA